MLLSPTTKNKICGRDEEEGEGELTERRSGEKGEVRGKEERGWAVCPGLHPAGLFRPWRN